jgi:Na+/proline symporter
MKYLNTIDYTVIFLYLTALVAIAFYLKKKASLSIEDYFLGANKLPWWAMGISGMASYIDMAGTMLIVSFLYILGPRGLYIEFRGGAVLILTFMLLWSGKWHYRSKCMTGAEWMEYRFGNSWGGQFARIISAVAVIMTTIGMLAYLIKALGMFMTMFFPYPPTTCAFIMIFIASLYTIVSGFYGVVFTDLFQSVIVISAIILISFIAIEKTADISSLSELAGRVTGNTEWINSSLKWKVSMPRGYTAYQDLMLLAFFYFLRNMFIGISSAGADPKYFGARNERECSTSSFLWTSLMAFRWPMMIGFAILGIILVNNFFPDQSILPQAANYIKLHVHNIPREKWSDIIADIINNPGSYSPDLINGIKNILHNDWQSKLALLSYDGTINPEKIVPAVILYNIPIGARGFLLIAFIAAAFSCFSSNVNMATAYFTKDIYQRYVHVKAHNKNLIFISYLFIVFMVLVSFLLAYNFQSITQIWGWLIMGLGGGLAIPAMLKFYWWRYNGGGFAIGTLVGIITSILEVNLFPSLLEWQQFAFVSIVALIATIIGTFLTAPPDETIAFNFYKTTRPFGFWKPYKAMLDPETRKIMEREHRNDLISVPFTLGWQVTLLLLPMQLMIGTYKEFFITLSIFLFCITGMYFFWYRNLPPKNKFVSAAVQEEQGAVKSI